MSELKIEQTVGVIGAGNMATAIIKGMLRKKLIDSKMLYIFDVDSLKASRLTEETSIHNSSSNKELVGNSSVIILAVKPNVYPIVLEEVKGNLHKEHILVSIAAGVSTQYIKEKIQDRCKVVRVMPNTPALIGEGMIAMCKGHGLGREDKETVLGILSALGKVEEVDEKYINAVTAISGSSPAYVYMFIEALADGGVMMGLPRDQAYRMISQAVLGSAKMMLDLQEHPGILKDMVCSPAGTTIEAVYALEQKGFRGTVMEAVKLCAEKGETMDKKEK